MTDSYIISSPAVSCTSSEYRALLPVFIIIGFVLLILFPALLFIAVYKWRHHLHAHDKNNINSNSSSSMYVQAMLGEVYESYTKRHYLYEIVVLLRRAALVAICVSLVNDHTQMYTAATLANIVILALHVHVQPFKQKIENQMVTTAIHSSTGFTLPSPTVPSSSFCSARVWMSVTDFVSVSVPCTVHFDTSIFLLCHAC